MIDTRTEELINLALDGTLNSAEHEELDRLLSVSNEARDYAVALQELDHRLNTLCELDVPATLHDDIMAAVTTTASLNPPLPKKSNVTILHVPTWPATLRYGLAASLGLGFAVAMYETQDFNSTANYEQMAGTIAPVEGSPQDTPYAFSITEDGLISKVSVAGNPEKLILDVDIDSNESIELIIRLDSNWRFDDLALAVSEPEVFSVAGNEIQIRGRGHQRFAVMLLPTARMATSRQSPIEFDYMRNGALVQQRVLDARAL